MKLNAGKRLIASVLALSVAAALLPHTMAAVPSSSDWAVEPFVQDELRVYRHESADSKEAARIENSSVDLADTIHIYIADSKISYCGIALMRADDARAVPVPGSTISDEGFYQLICSSSQGYNGTYFYRPGGNLVFTDEGYGENHTDGTSKCSGGMELKYRAGNAGAEYYVAPGRYRFVYFNRQGQFITYSGLFNITDNTGLFTGPGSMDASFTVSGASGPAKQLYADNTFDIKMTDIKNADGSDADLSGAVVKQIDLITNSSIYGIPTSGNSTDSIVSYSFDKAKTMYDTVGMSKGKYTDGRTVETDGSSVTLKNTTGEYLAYGSYLATLTEWDTQYMYRVMLTAEIGGEDRLFYCTAPVLFSPPLNVVDIYTENIPAGSVGEDYSFTLSGHSPDKSALTWSVERGFSLPPGLTLSEDGVISGVPETAGTYHFIIIATAANGMSASRNFSNVRIDKRRGNGSWLLNVNSSSYDRNTAADYDVVIKPMRNGTVEGTPSEGTRLELSLNEGVLTEESTVTVTRPASGVSAQKDGSRISLTFDGTAYVGQDGIAVTIGGARNSDSSENVLRLTGKWSTETEELDMRDAASYVQLYTVDGVMITINDWDKYSDMELRATVTDADGGCTVRTPYNGRILFTDLGIDDGESFSVKLEAADALWKWHEYYSGSFTGNGAGNMISITPDPAEEDVLTGYTVNVTLAGETAKDAIYYSLLKNGYSISDKWSYKDGVSKYWLADTDGFTSALSETTYRRTSAFDDYDTEGRISVSGSVITIDFRLLGYGGSVKGIVMDSSGAPLQGASVAASQTSNGFTRTLNALTGADGAFSIDGLYGGRNTELTAWAEGYAEKSIQTSSNSADVQMELEKSGRIFVAMADGSSVSDARLKIDDIKTYQFGGGSAFTLDLPAAADMSEGAEYEISMTSSDTAGTTKGTAVFGADGTAALTLSPERFGALDWSGVGGAGYYVNVYMDGSKKYMFPASDMTAYIPAGEYTVYLSAEPDKGDRDPGENVTVESGGVSVLSITPPQADKVIRASVRGPETAGSGSLYTVSGIVESESDSGGRDFLGLKLYSDSYSIEGYKINGSYIEAGGLYGSSIVTRYMESTKEADWGLPLSYTIYVRQKADIGRSQTISVSSLYSSTDAVENTINIGTVMTKSVPDITIGCQEKISSRTVRSVIGGTEQDTLMPDSVSFSGTAPADGTVRIYDNDALIALAKADKYGRYSGTAYPADAGSMHTLRAEYALSSDTVISAQIDYTYEAEAPVMKRLWLTPGAHGMKQRYQLAINGTATAYSWNPKNNAYTFEAEIENDELLDMITVASPTQTDEHEEMTGKVFFLVNTMTGSYVLLSHKNDAGYWETRNIILGDTPVTNVKVLYRGASERSVPIVSVEDEGGMVELSDGSRSSLMDHVFRLELKPGFTSTWEDKKDMLDLMGISEGDEVVSDLDYEEDGTWTDIYPEEDEDPDRSSAALLAEDETGAEENGAADESAKQREGGSYAELFENTKTMSDLFESIAAQFGDPENGMVDDPEAPDFETKDGVKEFTAINITEAQKRSDKYYEQRTWIDEPSWTESGLKKRVQTMKNLGYKAYSTTDPESGREFIYLRGIFYYDRYGEPVPSLYVNKTYSGIQRSEVSDRILKNGELIGSMLDVKYLYDVKGKKWVRMQSVTMPPNVTCPIHTSRGQIPCGSERALRYTPAEDVEYGTASLMDNRKRNGGLQMKIRLSKVSEKTVSGYALSVAGAGLGSAIDANKTLKNYVQIENKLGKYELGYLSNTNTLFFTGLGQLTGSGAKETSAPPNNIDLNTLRKLLEANYDYYAKLDGGTYKYTSEYGRERTKNILEKLGRIEYDVTQAGIQDAFTNKVTDQLTGASLVIGLFGSGYGTAGAFIADTISAYISAANDTNNEEVKEKLIGFRRDLEVYLNNDRNDKDRMMKSEQESIDYNKKLGFDVLSVEKNVFNDPFGGSVSGSDDLDKKKQPSGGGGGGGGAGGGGEPGGDDPGSGGGDAGQGTVNPTNTASQHTIETTPVTDPSGIVYEGVIENPVEGAMVTLYRYDSESGIPVMHDDAIYLNQDNPLLTDESGHYGWDVPEGEWYVTAQKEGYASGSSSNDSAAVIKHDVNGEEMSFLPVLPVQLDVNIPLVDASAPTVDRVRYTKNGIYITFSKYMVDSTNDAGSVLYSGNYTLSDVNGPIDFTVESAEQGHAPENIDSSGTTYSRTVILRPDGAEFGKEVSLGISGTPLSYAGVPIGAGYYEDAAIEPVSYKDGRVTLELDDVSSACVIYADFDDDGRFVSAASQLTAGRSSVEIPNPQPEDKILVWDGVNGMKPLALTVIK